MKKLLLSVALLLAGASSAVAQQKGDFVFSPTLSYQTESGHLGLGAKARYSFTDKIRIEGEGLYYLPKSAGYGDVKTSAFSLSVNGHYLLNIADMFTFYPLAGLGYYHPMISNSNLKLDGRLMFNVGAGAVLRLSPNFGIGAEFKYHMMKGANTPSLSTSFLVGI